MFYCDVLALGDTTLNAWTGEILTIRPLDDAEVTIASPRETGSCWLIQGCSRLDIVVPEAKSLLLPPALPPGAKLVGVSDAVVISTSRKRD